MKFPFCIAVFLWVGGVSFAQTQTIRFTERPSQFSHKRFWGVSGSILGIYGATLAGLSQYWYKDYPKSSFHFFNDGREWYGIDKAGHIFGSYFAGRWSVGMYRWTGMNDQAAIITGGLMGTFLLSSVEILDAFSSKWGFSGWDMLANLAGSAIVIGQEFAWHDQRVVIKLSALPQSYAPDLKSRTDYLFGESNIELFLKDYNAVTVWASANVKSFMKRDRRFPPWLNIAFGYGANGLLGGFENRWCHNPPSTAYCDCDVNNKVDRSDIERHPQFYLSLDVDFTRVQSQKTAVKILMHLLNIIKVPSPTLEFSRKGGVIFHPLFF